MRIQGAVVVEWEVPPSRRLAFVAVLAVVAASVLLTVLVSFRVGGYTLAAALALAGVLRATLPEQFCLGLLVRSRQLDVAIDASMAVVLAVATWKVPG
jgi:hypothetical protein